jgi:hypothetical protein
MLHLLSVYSTLNQIISPSRFLSVRAGQIYAPSTNTSFNYDLSNVHSLGISINIKDLSVLTLLLARVYISRDVTFGESIFPFSSLHPNAGACLKAEINLLPSHLVESFHNHNGVCTADEPSVIAEFSNPSGQAVLPLITHGKKSRWKSSPEACTM